VDTRGHILVVDDDESLLQLLDLTFSTQGYRVIPVANGRDAMRALYAHGPDIVILDIMLPEVSGWDVCRRIREVSDVPIVMLTAYAGQEHRIKGLELGADDYLSKPFDVQELALRVAAVLRRTLTVPPENAHPRHRYDDGHLFIDLDQHIVNYDGQPIQLSLHEFELLACFVRQPGVILSQRTLLQQVWNLDDVGSASNYVKTYVNYLRKKIEPDPRIPRYILTERGMGYRLARRGIKPMPSDSGD
jgi:DNA-binding response OmpR family regulator